MTRDQSRSSIAPMAAVHQTTRLSPGRHRSPRHGTCAMELSSLLGGERFSDHPARVCAVLAAFLRGYNDATSDRVRQELFGVAATVVDTRTTDSAVREERIHTLLGHAMDAWRHRGLRHFALPLVFAAPSGYTDIETAGAYVGRLAPRNRGLHKKAGRKSTHMHSSDAHISYGLLWLKRNKNRGWCGIGNRL